MKKGLSGLLTVYELPAVHRQMVRTTNPTKRPFREVRRQIDSIATCVNNGGVQRIVYGLVAYHNARYATRVCNEFQNARWWPDTPTRNDCFS